MLVCSGPEESDEDDEDDEISEMVPLWKKATYLAHCAPLESLRSQPSQSSVGSSRVEGACALPLISHVAALEDNCEVLTPN